jgi:hypothetical protein
VYLLIGLAALWRLDIRRRTDPSPFAATSPSSNATGNGSPAGSAPATKNERSAAVSRESLAALADRKALLATRASWIA